MEVQPRRTWRFKLSDLYCVTTKIAAKIAVETVGKRDVDDAIDAAERDSGLGAVACKRPKALALASGKQHPDGLPHVSNGHGRASPENSGDANARILTAMELRRTPAKNA